MNATSVKPEFLTHLNVQKLRSELDEKKGRARWQLLSDFRYRSALVPEEITARCSFVSDFSSVPRLPLAYLLAGDTAHEAAVIHDWIYQTHIYPKEMADRIFLEAMGAMGVPRWRREIMYLAVKYRGGSSYKSGPERFTVLNCGC